MEKWAIKYLIWQQLFIHLLCLNLNNIRPTFKTNIFIEDITKLITNPINTSPANEIGNEIGIGIGMSTIEEVIVNAKKFYSIYSLEN